MPPNELYHYVKIQNMQVVLAAHVLNVALPVHNVTRIVDRLALDTHDEGVKTAFHSGYALAFTISTMSSERR
jgi:hypothetical protein